MLDADGEHALGVFLDRFALIVQVFELHQCRAFDLVVILGDREAALFIGQGLFRRPDDLGVHEETRRFGLVLARQVHDDHPLGDADLDRGEADAWGLVHGLQHVIHQGAHRIVDHGDGL